MQACFHIPSVRCPNCGGKPDLPIVAEVRSEALPHTPTKDPNNELDELREILGDDDWKYSEKPARLQALIDKKVTEASEAQFKLGYEAGVSATNGTLKGTSWKEARAQLSKPKEEER